MSDELGRRKRVEGLPEWVRPMLDSGSWLGATCAFPVGQDAVSYDVHTPDAKRWLLVRRDRRSGHRSVILVYGAKPDPLEVCELIVADWRWLCNQGYMGWMVEPDWRLLCSREDGVRSDAYRKAQAKLGDGALLRRADTLPEWVRPFLDRNAWRRGRVTPGGGTHYWYGVEVSGACHHIVRHGGRGGADVVGTLEDCEPDQLEVCELIVS